MIKLDPKPFVFIDRGVEHRRTSTPKEWDSSPNYNPYSFRPREGYEQDRTGLNTPCNALCAILTA